MRLHRFHSLLIVGAIAIIPVIVSGCNKEMNSSNKPVTNKTISTISINKRNPRFEVALTKIDTNQEIEAAKEVVEKYFVAIKNDDIDLFRTTLDEYKDDYPEQFWKGERKKWSEFDFLAIEYPGKWHTAEEQKDAYARYTIDNNRPYRVAFLNVTYGSVKKAENGGLDNIDFILIKKTSNSAWLIHDWGR